MKFYVDADGNYLGGWDETPPEDGLEVPTAPEDARQVWAFPGWQPVRKSKEEALSELNAAYQAEFDELSAQYPAAEREGWTVQLREADAYGSPGAEMPCLDALLAARNEGAEVPETMAELIGKIRAKNAAYAAGYGTLTGKRHRLERAVKEARTPEQLAAVVW